MSGVSLSPAILEMPNMAEHPVVVECKVQPVLVRNAAYSQRDPVMYIERFFSAVPIDLLIGRELRQPDMAIGSGTSS